jgi:hypothetical protein
MTHYKIQHKEKKDDKDITITYTLKNIITSHISEYQFRESPLRPDQSPDVI